MNPRSWTGGRRAFGGLAVAGCAAMALALVAGTGLQVEAVQPMPLTMLVACVEVDEQGAFHLTKATEPEEIADRLPPQPEQTAALGVQRVRLIGTLDEFGVARHVGHKVWAKGLLIEDDAERRLNLVSITHLSPDCR